MTYYIRLPSISWQEKYILLLLTNQPAADHSILSSRSVHLIPGQIQGRHWLRKQHPQNIHGILRAYTCLLMDGLARSAHLKQPGIIFQNHLRVRGVTWSDHYAVSYSGD